MDNCTPTRLRPPSGRRVRLPGADGTLSWFDIPEQVAWRPAGAIAADRSRLFFAAPHVIAADHTTIDVDATLAFREHIWSRGLGVAEVMDTAQRGMGLGWADVRAVLGRTAAIAAGRPLVAGVGTDQITEPAPTLTHIRDAYVEQLAVAAEADATPVIMASRHLAAAANGVDDYFAVYQHVVAAADRPVVLHWLGEAFDPLLRGYWGTAGIDEAIDRLADFIEDNRDRVDGIKVSLLETRYELALRRRLPAGVRLYTGDDFNFPELIRGDGAQHSDALLGAFNPLAPLAAQALDLFDDGRDDDAQRVLERGLPLSKVIFEAPTPYYKAGVVFLSWLNGHQDEFVMLDAVEKRRSPEHYARVFSEAALAGVLRDPELAAARVQAYMSEAGVHE